MLFMSAIYARWPITIGRWSWDANSPPKNPNLLDLQPVIPTRENDEHSQWPVYLQSNDIEGK
jgi:hypothetical protein